ncbi:hypothetical protein QTN25_002888 [Entamoeba marina]
MISFLALITINYAVTITVPFITSTNGSIVSFNMYETDKCYVQSSTSSLKLITTDTGYGLAIYSNDYCYGTATEEDISEYSIGELDYSGSYFNRDNSTCAYSTSNEYNPNYIYLTTSCIETETTYSNKYVCTEGKIVYRRYDEPDCEGKYYNLQEYNCGECSSNSDHSIYYKCGNSCVSGESSCSAENKDSEDNGTILKQVILIGVMTLIFVI